MQSDGQIPTISIIIPTLDEENYIARCLQSLEEQDYPQIIEILVVDGGSKDTTRDIVSHWGGVVRLVDNPGVTAASAMNVGINAAQGEVVVRIDAHSSYSPDYCSRSVEVLLETGAAVVGGPMRPQGDTKFGQAVSIATTTPIGIGPGRFHYANQRCEVETVYLGAFRPETVRSVGGYDSSNLQWAAEDQELNYRIRLAGGTIVLDPTIKSIYVPRGTVRSLAKQYHNYGLCKVSTLVKHRTLPYWRPTVPPAFVCVCMLWLVTFLLLGQFGLAFLPIGFYLLASMAAAVFLTRRTPSLWWRTALALVVIHWSYGFGFLRGIGKALTGRKFDTKPRRRRV